MLVFIKGDNNLYKVNECISAIYVDASPYGRSSGNLRVYIPSLMPNISMGYPRTTQVSLNRSCYCNANECKPSVSTTINTQNFVTAIEAYFKYSKPCYRYGTDIAVIAKREDCLTCRLAPDEEDNSIPDPNPPKEEDVEE